MGVATKLMLLVLVLATFALPMVITGPSGRPLMRLGDWLPEINLPNKLGVSKAVAQLTSAKGVSQNRAELDNSILVQLPQQPPRLQATSSGQMYKWQDQQGRWHFSNEKSDDMINATVEDLPEIKNVMEAAVNRGQNSSTMSLPDLGNAGALLERLQRSAAGSEQ